MTTPNLKSKNYIHTSKGGYNIAIRVDGYFDGSVLSNCVGYAWGRLREQLGYNPKMGVCHAVDLWDYADGYTKSQTPSAGDIGVYSGQTYGHVIIVEEVHSNGDITISESNYGQPGSGYVKRTLYKVNNYQPYAGYKLLGFKQTELTKKLKENNVSDYNKKWDVHYKLLSTKKFANRPRGITEMYEVELLVTRDKYDVKTGKKVGQIGPKNTPNGKPLLVWYGGKTSKGNKKHYYDDKGTIYYYVSETKK